MTTPAAAPPRPTSAPETYEEFRERMNDEYTTGLDKVGPRYPEVDDEGSIP